MVYGRGGRLRWIAPKGLLVESFFQDGLHVFVGVRLNEESSGTGGLQALGGVEFAQADDAQAGAEPLFRMGSMFEDGGDEFFGLGSCLSGPVDDAGRGPLEVFLMRFGHVLWQGGKSSWAMTSGMAGHPVVFAEDFDGGGSESEVDLFFDQRIRDAVVMAVDLHMIVDIDPGLFPFGELVGLFGKRLQGGFV